MCFLADRAPTKICTKCHEAKPLEAFRPRRAGKYGRQAQCRQCDSLRERLRYEKNPQHFREKKRRNYQKDIEHSRALARQQNLKRAGANKRWRLENRDKIQERMKRYDAARAEERKSTNHTNYLANKAVIDARNAAWQRNNREHVNTYNRQRRKEKHAHVLAVRRQWTAANRQRLQVQSRALRQRYPERSQSYLLRYIAKDPDGYKEMRRLIAARRRARQRMLPATMTREDWHMALEYWGYACAVCGMRTGLFHRIVPDHWIALANPLSPGDVPTNVVPLCHTMHRSYPSCNLSKKDRDSEDWLLSRYGPHKAKSILKAVDTYFAVVRARKGQAAAD